MDSIINHGVPPPARKMGIGYRNLAEEGSQTRQRSVLDRCWLTLGGQIASRAQNIGVELSELNAASQRVLIYISSMGASSIREVQ